MKKSLLVWGALIVIALCFVGCCYYNTTHCTHHHASADNCPTCDQQDGDDGDVETVTIEAVELVPTDAPAQGNAPAANAPATHTHPAPAANAPASGN